MAERELPAAAEAFLDQWGPGMQQDPGLRADLAALLAETRAAEREACAALLENKGDRTVDSADRTLLYAYADEIRGMK